ncbi:MAG: DUF815 domain-containing protein, partial [Alphaproteobacteria bacterium]|nr:DUF815 domain-containing protein [Alphaproteobacteria bacterium]
MTDDALARLDRKLDAVIATLMRIAPPQPAENDLDAADCFVWEPVRQHLQPIAEVNRVALPLLHGIDHVRDILHDNTKRFAEGRPANNALLWGARGMGKSSLVKAIHADIATGMSGPSQLKLVEIHREDIDTMPHLLRIVRDSAHRFILFCDDLSFD